MKPRMRRRKSQTGKRIITHAFLVLVVLILVIINISVMRNIGYLEAGTLTAVLLAAGIGIMAYGIFMNYLMFQITLKRGWVGFLYTIVGSGFGLAIGTNIAFVLYHNIGAVGLGGALGSLAGLWIVAMFA